MVCAAVPNYLFENFRITSGARSALQGNSIFMNKIKQLSDAGYTPLFLWSENHCYILYLLIYFTNYTLGHEEFESNLGSPKSRLNICLLWFQNLRNLKTYYRGFKKKQYNFFKTHLLFFKRKNTFNFHVIYLQNAINFST